MTSPVSRRIVVVGGGPAGFLAAITCKSATPAADVLILEMGRETLVKLALSGGGRCNLTNAGASHRSAARYYPRGGRELLGPLSRFGVEQTMEWFESRGVALVTEPDGRVFPSCQRAAAVVDCLRREATTAGVTVQTGAEVAHLAWDPGASEFDVGLSDGSALAADRVIIAAGGGDACRIAADLGHAIIDPVPALFGLHIDDPRISELPGIAVDEVEVWFGDGGARERGPVLVTHEGLSGPAILRLSSLAARELYACRYKAQLCVNWAPSIDENLMREDLSALRDAAARSVIAAEGHFGLPNRLWRALVLAAGCTDNLTWAHLSRSQLLALVEQVRCTRLQTAGRSANKEEFVTAGGVDLKELDMRSMQSKLRPGLFFAGEVVDIDGLTGGYNLQAAWTTGWVAGSSAAV